MSRLATRIRDKRVLKLIRRYLTAGTMIGGLVSPGIEGTPQGNCGKSLDQIIKELNQYLIGWWNYYRLTEARYLFKSLNGWIIRRLRCIVWKHWKNPRTKVRNLEKLGIVHKDAVRCGNARKKHWRMSKVKWVIVALPNRYFFERGLFLPAQ